MVACPGSFLAYAHIMIFIISHNSILKRLNRCQIRWAHGNSVIVAPGGAFYFLMIDKEGAEVAKMAHETGHYCFCFKISCSIHTGKRWRKNAHPE